MADIISRLPENEKKALSLCGISQDSQLLAIKPEALLKDLDTAKQFFPNEASALTEGRVREIYAAIQNIEAQATQTEDAKPAEPQATVMAGSKTMTAERALPVFVPRRHQHRSHSNTTPEKLQKAPGVSHSIRCTRPVATYLAALCMLGFYAGLLTIVLMPFMLFMGYIEDEDLVKVLVTGIGLMIPYAIHGAWVPCSVCNMRFLMLRHYNINRHAHMVPFLGLVTLATSLHLIFLFWYRCPACGTSLRLYRHRH